MFGNGYETLIKAMFYNDSWLRIFFFFFNEVQLIYNVFGIHQIESVS